MRDNARDPRVKRTRAALRAALFRQLMTRALTDISVTELTDDSGVNRSTFYLHYRDVADLYRQTEAEIVDEFDLALKRAIADRGALFPVVEAAFQFVHKHADACRALLQSGGGEFLERLIDRERPKPGDTRLISFPVEEDGYLLDFVMAGCVGVMRSWLDSGMKESPEQMAALTEALMSPQRAPKKTCPANF